MNPVTGSPIADPTVTVGVETFALRYSLIAEYKISEWGVDVGALLRSLDSRTGDPKRFFYTCQLFAACVAHQFAAKGEPVPTAEQWMIRLSEIEPDYEKMVKAFALIGAGVVEAILKRFPAPKAAGMPDQDKALAN